MERTDTAGMLRPSWVALAQLLAGAAIFGAVGYAMVQGEGWVLKTLGVLLLLGVGAFVIATPFRGLPRRGPCPRCKCPMEASGRVERDLLCPKCCSYFDAENERLSPIKDRERIRSQPTYAVPTPWEDLRIVTSPTIGMASSVPEALLESALEKPGNTRTWEPRWPPGCCVCGQPEVHRVPLITPVVKQLKFRKESISIVLLGVPYCSEHNEGVRMRTTTFDDQEHSSRFALLFKSFAYRNAFFDLNPGEFYKNPSSA